MDGCLKRSRLRGPGKAKRDGLRFSRENSKLISSATQRSHKSSKLSASWRGLKLDSRACPSRQQSTPGSSYRAAPSRVRVGTFLVGDCCGHSSDRSPPGPHSRKWTLDHPRRPRSRVSSTSSANPPNRNCRTSAHLTVYPRLETKLTSSFA